MPQFTVYKNRNPVTKARVPYLLDVQSDLLGSLDTRVVIPLYAAGTLKGQAMTVLMPRFDLEGKDCVLMTPQLAGIASKELGAAVADLSAHRDAIIAAIDLLVTGI